MVNMKPRTQSLLLLVFSLLFCVLITVCCDRLVGHFHYHGQSQPGLVFPPGSQIILRSPEFNSLAVVNSLGFRDREFSVQKSNSYRIIAIGDSFTFGWGVNIETTWVKQLEDDLRQRGHNIEIANLGRGGFYPRLYADIAERAIPMLKPDLVLVAVLQGDDLAQGGEEGRQLRAVVSQNARVLFPNLMALARAIKNAGEETAVQTATWQKEIVEVLEKVGETGKAKFDSFDDTVRRLYSEGKLNPALLDLALRRPRRIAATMDLVNPSTRALIVEMGNQLLRIGRVAARQGAEVLVVSIPFRTYVNKFGLDQTRRLGFITTEDMLISTAPDDAIRLASDKAGLKFRSVTKIFRQRAQTRDDPYFEFDGHFNRDGHALFSELLVPIIESFAGEHMRRPPLPDEAAGNR